MKFAILQNVFIVSIKIKISNLETYCSTSSCKTRPQAVIVVCPCNLMVLLRSLSMNAGFAFNLSLTYETRASSASLLAFSASSMRERRVLRQSFLFSSRCSNLHQRERNREIIIFFLNKSS